MTAVVENATKLQRPRKIIMLKIFMLTKFVLQTDLH